MRRAFTLFLASLTCTPGWAQTAALPTGGQVAAGNASISNISPTQQKITQGSDRAIINWQGFSIGAGNSVQFSQPSSSSVVLNRVVGGDTSSILGSLSANGQVFLVNPNGIYFGRGATLDVTGLVASTLNIRDGDFLAGRYDFFRDPASPARAEVINEGVIAARQGGYVVLAGDYAANRGTVEARLGTVALGSGDKMTLDVVGDSLVNFAVNEKTVAAMAGVANAGKLMADGGRVVMTAATARNLANSAVNNSGVIQAQTVSERNGVVYLMADGGTAQTSGSIDVSGRKAGEKGGSVRVLGDRVAASGAARIDASGDAGGGQVLIGGNFHGAGPEANSGATWVGADARIAADAITSGDGGKVAVWSDGRTDFYGGISARGGASEGNGGFAEVSGKGVLNFAGAADLRAPAGANGTLLLDPSNITISTGADASIVQASPGVFSDDTTTPTGTSVLNVTTLTTQLGLSDVTVTTTSTAASAGNITVADAIPDWGNANTLTLFANNQIALNNSITAAAGGLVLNAAAGVTQNGSGAVSVPRLSLLGGGTFGLNGAANSVGTLGASVNGAVNFTNGIDLDIGAAGAATGLQTNSHAVSLNVTGNLTQSAGGINASTLELIASGNATLNLSTNSVTTLGADVGGSLVFRNSGNLNLGTAGGTSGINAPGATVTLIATGNLAQTAGVVNAASLEAIAGGSATFANSNTVGSFAATTTGNLTFNAAGALNIATLGGTAGVNTNGGNFTLTVAGDLTQSVDAPIAASTFTLRDTLAAANATLIHADNKVRFLAADINGGEFLYHNAGDLNTVTSGGIAGVNTHDGNLAIDVPTGSFILGDGGNAGPLNAGTGWINLSGDTILQNANSGVFANALSAQTTRFVGIRAGNQIDSINTLALSATGTGDSRGLALDIGNNKSLTIGSLTTKTAKDGSFITTTGINSTADVLLIANGNLTLNQPIVARNLGLWAWDGGGAYFAINDNSTISATGLSLKASADPGLAAASLASVTQLSAHINSGSFNYTAPNELTIAKLFDFGGVTVPNGNVSITTGQFAGYDPTLPFASFAIAGTNRFKAGLTLDEGLTVSGGVYLNSGSGIYQWFTDTSASPPAQRAQSAIKSGSLVLAGQGNFDLSTGDNTIGTLAANINGGLNFASSSPYTVGNPVLNWTGLPGGPVNIAGITARADTLISGTAGQPDAVYNSHNVTLTAGRGTAGAALTIQNNITADPKGSSLITLGVGGDADAAVATTGGARVTAGNLVFSGDVGKGTFNVTANTGIFSAVGGKWMVLDNTANTGNLTLLGLGSLQGSGAKPVGDMYIFGGGDIVSLGGTSQGNYLLMRGGSINLAATMTMKDGASVILQPVNAGANIGIHNVAEPGFVPAANYARTFLQSFSQNTTFYVGATPTAMINDASVPTAAKSGYSYSGNIHMGYDGDLKLGFRSLSAETSGSITAANAGQVYNLRLKAPTVSVANYNVTGTRVDLIADKLNLTGADSSHYVTPDHPSGAATPRAEILLRGYNNKTIWIGNMPVGYGDVNYSWALLDKFPSNSTILIDGTPDQQNVNHIFLAYDNAYHSLGGRKLILGTKEAVHTGSTCAAYVSIACPYFGANWSLSSWNNANEPDLYRVEAYNGDNTGIPVYEAGSGSSRHTLPFWGDIGVNWAGCPSLADCQANGTPGGNGGGGSTGGTNPGGGAGSCVDPTTCSGGGSVTPPPPAPGGPGGPGGVIATAVDTGGGSGSGGSNPGSGAGGAGDADDGLGGPPGGGMSDGGPSGFAGNNNGSGDLSGSGGGGGSSGLADSGSGGGGGLGGSGGGSGSGLASAGGGSGGADSGSGGSGSGAGSDGSAGFGSGSGGSGSGSGLDSGDGGSGLASAGGGAGSGGAGDSGSGSGNGSSGSGSGGSGLGDGDGNLASAAGSGGASGAGDSGDGSGSGSTGSGSGGGGLGDDGSGSLASASGSGGGSGAGDSGDGGTGSGSLGSGSGSSGLSDDGGGNLASASGSGGASGAGDSGDGGAGSGSLGSGSAGSGLSDDGGGNLASASGSGGASGAGDSGSGAGSGSQGSGNSGGGLGDGSGSGGGSGRSDDGGGNLASAAAGGGASGAGDSGDGSGSGSQGSGSGGAGRADDGGGNLASAAGGGASGGASSGEGGGGSQGSGSGGSGVSGDGNVASARGGGAGAADSGDSFGTGQSGGNAGGADSGSAGASGRGGQATAQASGASAGAGSGSDTTSGSAGSAGGEGGGASDRAGGSGRAQGQTSVARASQAQGGGSAGSAGAGTSGAALSGGTICVGTQSASRNDDQTERNDSFANHPLIDVRGGGVNMQNDCSRNNSAIGPLSSAR